MAGGRARGSRRAVRLSEGGGLMARASRLLALWALAAVALPGSEEEGDGGWRPGGPWAVAEEERCTVERRSDLTYAEFVQQYAFVRPVILQGLTDNSRFRALCSREKLLASFGDRVVRLSTANTYSYQKGAGSGVPFHWHGPGYSEVIYGRKRWFLYPPEKTPEFHPNKTTLAWLRDTYPALPPSARPLECTIRAGEVSGWQERARPGQRPPANLCCTPFLHQVLYFPDRWWHATLNLDTSVFISTFLG
ncbi:hypothetical protein H8959_009778 [Pygathrix nigripes]